MKRCRLLVGLVFFFAAPILSNDFWRLVPYPDSSSRGLFWSEDAPPAIKLIDQGCCVSVYYHGGVLQTAYWVSGDWIPWQDVPLGPLHFRPNWGNGYVAHLGKRGDKAFFRLRAGFR